jgi:hypothetical protein
VIVVAACTISACGASTNSSLDASAQNVAASASAVLANIDSLVAAYPDRDKGIFLAGIRDSVSSSTNEITDKWLLRLGAIVCLKFREGATASSMAQLMISFGKQAGVSTNDAAAIESAAVVNLCPQYAAAAGGANAS